ncbi:MAG: PilZ domain-containing protein [Desulfobacterales bacterium]|nr:PilZ domain-containing protein [Desulfobacterales bacterium]
MLAQGLCGIKKDKSTAVEKRRSKRWNLINSLRVFEQKTEEFVGYLMDINKNGMMLASEEPVPLGKGFHFWIEVMSEKILVDVHTLWTKKDDEWGYYKNGFRFVNPTSEMTTNIMCLIEALKFQD